MKKLKLSLLMLASLVFGRPAGMSTANGAADVAQQAADDVATLKKQFDDQAAQIADLQAQLAAKNAAPAEVEDNSTLALLAKGAGVDLKDVIWRKRAGLDDDQAVAAAAAQKKYDADKKAKAATAAAKAAKK